MASVETAFTLRADQEAVARFLDEHGGRLVGDEEEPTVYWLVLRPKHDQADVYYVRIAWAAYPEAPPSVTFADGIDGAIAIPRAWPNISGYRVGSWDICKPFTAEGFNVHPDWRIGPTAWCSSGNPFLWVVQTLQFDLNNNREGRHA